MELNTVLTFVEDHAMTGLSNLSAFVWATFVAMAIISICVNWNLYTGDLKLQIVIQKIMWISGLIFLIGNWSNMVSMAMDTFRLAGVVAAGLSSSNAPALTPDGILDSGMTIAGNLLSALSNCSVIGMFFKGLVYLAACLLIIITTGQIALSVLMTEIGFVLIAVVGFVSLPFALCDKTKFFFDKTISNIFAVSIKMMVLSFMLGLYSVYVKNIAQIPATADFAVILKNAIGIAVFSYLTAKIPDSVASMFAGGQVFQAGSIAGAAVGVASAATSKPVMTGAVGAGRAVIKAAPYAQRGYNATSEALKKWGKKE